MLSLLDADGPRLLYLHGIPGIGKSTLLSTFAATARSMGVTVVGLDCRSIEPTERGFLHSLSRAIGSRARTAGSVASRLGSLGDRIVLTLDTYEVFRFLDLWLREVFVPALPKNVRVVLCGREPAVTAWLTSPRWEGSFSSLTLEALSDREALELLAGSGVDSTVGRRINRLAHGNPLALKLAAATIAERPGRDLEMQTLPEVIDALARLYLADVTDPLTRRVLQTGSVVRRVTHSLLRAMLPNTAPDDAFERLRVLPFTTSGRDGLIIHDAVREGIAAHMRAMDPNTFRDLKRRAWRQLQAESHDAGIDELWRYTADILYLLENPVIREAFFPTGAPQFSVQSFRPEDFEAVVEILEKHDTEESRLSTLEWLQAHPETFFVVRDLRGVVAGFHCIFDPQRVSSALLHKDRMTNAWYEHLQAEPVAGSETVLFLRSLLSAQWREMPSSVQAASWLEIKRTYMALRPKLRRIYAALRDEAAAAFAPVMTTLGFRPVGRLNLGENYNLAVNDFGPQSVDGWLARLVAAEIGIEASTILDREAHEAVVDGRRIPLTRLELSVLEYLQDHANRAVSRASLIEDVWGYSYTGGSNVVDAVIRSLRKKLGERASVIETVSGVGYRVRDAVN
jgi:Transcriptional regulatory protein, C terminal